ncbi:nucleolar and coiled-body phosphoprotein 1 [Biomphalaria pfeifferi]|uniref:Nucleolar and coiled-body phosphoprotein 1 n=1 Tax=Biomphalaria pfeifferi TaxID=112525 RepID=A0AAD8B1J3_BIOPF|nr:nucleolar and coiled-body phosphoprotein 1 [Biomphalaria pfeifferi]
MIDSLKQDVDLIVLRRCDPVKPGTSGQKPFTRDSDQSLISVDSSENEEDLFGASNWKGRVAAKKTSDQRALSNSSDSGMDSIDFGSIQKTDILNNAAAKAKISVKPKARNRQSRKKRDTPSPLTLPSLNEESPTKQVPEDASFAQKIATSSSVVEQPEKSPVKSPVSDLPTQPSPKLSKKIEPDGLRLNLTSLGTSSKGDNDLPGSPVAAPIVGTPSSSKASTPSSPGHRSTILFKPGESQVSSSLLTSPTSPSIKASSEMNITEKPSLDKFSSSSRGIDKLPLTFQQEELMDKPSHTLHQGGSDLNEDKPNIDLKSRMSQFEAKSHTSEPALKISDPSSNITVSPKEDYKIKRQVRSKTLPGTSEEQASPRVQRTSSHRIPMTTTGSLEHPLQMGLSLASEKIPDSPTASCPQTPPVSSSVKKLENWRFPSQDPHAISEPRWKDIIRKKKEDADDAESSKHAASDLLKQKSGLAADKKVETVSLKQKDFTPEKKVEISANSSDVTIEKSCLSKKESLELDVSELNSVRLMKPSQEVKLSATVTTNLSSATGGDKNKLSQGAGSLDKEETAKPSTKDIRGIFGGSVRDSFTKSSEISYNRPGSVKTPASVSASLGYKMLASQGSSKSLKPDVPLNVKQDSISSSAAQTLSSASSSVTTTPPTSSMTSSSQAVTAPAAAIKPITSVQSAKGSTSFAFTPKPVSTPVSKPATSPLSPTQPAFHSVKPFGVGIKPLASDPSPAVSTPSTFVPTSVSSSSSVDAPAPSATHITSTRPHSSFTTSATPKPQVSSASVPALLPKSVLHTKPVDSKVVLEDKKPEPTSNVPAWRANLKNDASKKEVKIEIIEKTPTPNSDILRKGSDKAKSSQVTKKDSVSSTGSNIQLDSASNRSSKVMDMVKNFQNLKITS